MVVSPAWKAAVSPGPPLPLMVTVSPEHSRLVRVKPVSAPSGTALDHRQGRGAGLTAPA
jgi:hypothetical protein